MIEPTFASYSERVCAECTAAGHLDVAGFARLFDRATDAFRDRFGIGAGYAQATQSGLVVAESHCTYVREAKEGDVLRFRTWLLGATDKRMHLFHEMRREPDGELVATSELMLVHVDRARGVSVPFPARARAAADACIAPRDASRLPSQVGRSIALSPPREPR